MKDLGFVDEINKKTNVPVFPDIEFSVDSVIKICFLQIYVLAIFSSCWANILCTKRHT